MRSAASRNIVWRQYLPLVAAIGGFLFDLTAFYPGFMSPDTFDQYAQSLSFHYNDWHPPVMAGLWSLLNFIHHGPQPMFLFQLLLLWSSFYMLATSWFRGRGAFILLFIVLFAAPYTQNFAAYIIGDAQMALSWLLAVSIVLRAYFQKRKMFPAEAILSLVLIFYGLAVRINAFPGVIPLLFLWVNNMVQTRKVSRQLVWTLGMLATGLLLQFSLNKMVFKPEKKYPEYKLILYDIAGVRVSTGKSYYPDFIRQYPGFDDGYVTGKFNTATFDDIWWNADNKQLFPPLDEEKKGVLIKCWGKALRENPGAYLKNHFDGFLYYMQVKRRPGIAYYYYYYPLIYPVDNPHGFAFTRNKVSVAATRLLHLQEHMPYMKPWFWALLSVIQLFIIARQPSSSILKTTCFCLIASAILYLAPQFFIFQVDTDFRYFYWVCLSNALSAALLLKARFMAS